MWEVTEGGYDRGERLNQAEFAVGPDWKSKNARGM
jgi:hypothetical protein